MTNLQGIIGTDEKNPHVSVYRDPIRKELHVYHGFALFDIIPDVKGSVPHKFLAIQLFNANVKISTISKHFGYCYRSIKKWSDALKNGSAEEIVKAIEGHGPRKLTPEIEGFATYEFNRIYPRNKSTYSKEIRKGIEKVFKVKLSSETMRPLFKRLRENHAAFADEDPKKK